MISTGATGYNFQLVINCQILVARSAYSPPIVLVHQIYQHDIVHTLRYTPIELNLL